MVSDMALYTKHNTRACAQCHGKCNHIADLAVLSVSLQLHKGYLVQKVPWLF